MLRGAKGRGDHDLKIGSHVVNVQHALQPYLEDIERGARQLPRQEQKDAWRAHTAWVAFDLLDNQLDMETTVGSAYAVLARLALELLDENVSAVLPKENALTPNDGTAADGLRILLREDAFTPRAP
jgi:hypothetical protein